MGSTGTLYFSFNSLANLFVSGRLGCWELSITMNGFPIDFNSSMTLFSASM